MTAAEIQAWFDALIGQYNLGQVSQSAMDSARRAYDLEMAQLSASTVVTKQALTVALVLGGVFLLAKYGRR